MDYKEFYTTELGKLFCAFEFALTDATRYDARLESEEVVFGHKLKIAQDKWDRADKTRKAFLTFIMVKQ
jgi:hypothetical protein